MSTKTKAGPAWDNATEYASLTAPALTADVEQAQRLITELAALSARLVPLVPRAAALTTAETAEGARVAQEAAGLYERAMILLANVSTYVNCVLSVDAVDSTAKALHGRLQVIDAQLGQAWNAVRQLLKLAPDAFVDQYLTAPHTAPQRFAVAQDRKLRDHALSLAEEDLLIGVAVNGPSAWGTLYDNLSGTIRCDLNLADGTGGTGGTDAAGGKRQVGLAEAASLSQDEREVVRQAAFRATQKGWEAHEESAAAVLNALAGWRLDLYKRRSHKRPLHFLDTPLHQSRITRATLDAMLGAVAEAAPLGRRVLQLQAQVLGKPKLGPWDLFAPCPKRGQGGWQAPSFDEAIAIIADAYSTIHPEMGAFVRMMAEKKWIEATVGPNKRPGAYCTKFAKSRTPRVYMTYTGGMRELKTLAHELGHAFHNWVMRDLPLIETSYPMTLAETASIFGETVVNDVLTSRATTPGDRLSFTWAQAREVESLLLNIPARFQFERSLYERRQTTTLTPADLKQMMTESWQAWYGDGLSEMDPMFWASKLHFSISSLSFYNFPYTFGYLFANGVYAQRTRLGAKFHDAYVALLRDTGRMTAEEVAAKHLGADLTKPDFWRQSLAISKQAVAQFEDAVRSTEP